MSKAIFILCGFFSLPTFAQKTESKITSMRERALMESSVSEKQKKNLASDAQVSGTMLKLDDPAPTAEIRTWRYSVGFTAQQFQAEGYVRTDFGQRFDLNSNGQTVMPGLEVGVLTPTWALGDANLTLGAKIKGSYSSQKTDAVMVSGYTTDARLNSTLLSAGPLVRLAWEKYSWLSLNLGAQFGDLSYTQSSSNKFAQFSQHAGFNAYSYGLGFQVSRNWSVTTDWTQRSLTSNPTVALQNNNFELGTQITW